MNIKTMMKFIHYRKLPFAMMAFIIALAVMVLVNALAVLLKTHQDIEQTPYLGANTVALWVKYLEDGVDHSAQAQADRDALLSLPDVDVVSFATPTPYGGGGPEMTLERGNGQDEISVSVFYADEYFLPALDIELVAGRNFNASEVVPATAEDALQPTLVIINQTLASKLFGDDSPLGKTIQNAAQSYTVIGVLDPLVGANFKAQRGKFTLVLPQQKLGKWTSMLVHTNNPQSIQSLSQKLADVIYAQPVKRLLTRNEPLLAQRSLGLQKEMALGAILKAVIMAFLLVVFAAVWGVVKFNFVARKKSMGIARALGLSANRQMAMVTLEFSLVCLAGVLIGTLLSVFFANWFNEAFAIARVSNWLMLLIGIAMLVLVNLVVQFHLAQTQKSSLADIIYH
ncbi:ABC transporter permease [Pseudoalteromonas sp. MMG022]|uniref:ABC transporter permease n=1 Tax=Pseudoalteromonas sp. MMG022 TaxID=2909978 RepID=UPI001F37B90B|nr:ABC transporter permease [Pseudoalteromonas sp. MMG022]MCF6434903.1 ABC transporter permease [Pseudoalteromonas sp. MMG022]